MTDCDCGCSERIDALEAELEQERVTRGQNDAEIHTRITNLEDSLGIEPFDDSIADVTGQLRENATELEKEIVTGAGTRRSARKKKIDRARYIGKDIEQYGDGRGAGGVSIEVVIIRDILQSQEGLADYTSARRTASALVHLGKPHTELDDSRDNLRVVMDNELVDAINGLTNDD